jgi:hypothetical protein
MVRHLAAAAVIMTVVAAPGRGRAAGDPIVDAKPSARFHGSTVLLDQSATTQTVGVGSDFQSANPTYEWWLAVKPQYYLIEKEDRFLRVGLWANATLEMTNSETTTRSREVQLGPTYLSLVYGQALRDWKDNRDYRLSFTLGPRLTLPTEKAAWNSGQLLGAGATGELSQAFPLRGKHARVLIGGRVALGASYSHSIDRATSPVSSDLRQLRQDIAGRPILSDQLRGNMNVHDSLILFGTGTLLVTKRLEASMSYILGNSWVYGPTGGCVQALTGCVVPAGVADPTTYRVSTWLTAAVGYQVSDALTVSAGYYNRASQIGPDGTRRSPFWSPSARFFLTLVGSLGS